MKDAVQDRTLCSEFPNDLAARAEFELEIFGGHLFWMRNRRVGSISALVNDEERRIRLGTIRRKVYDQVAALDERGRQAAVKLAESAIDLYMQDLLGLLSNTGSDLSVGDDCAIRYRLVAEIIGLDLHVCWEDIINRNSKKHLPDYFGKWLNKFKGLGRKNDD